MNYISQAKIKLMKYPYKLLGKKEQMLLSGSKSLEELPNLIKGLGIKNLLIVSGKTTGKLELVTALKVNLEEIGINIAHYWEVSGEPTFLVCDRISYECRKSRAEAIIAIGGGSVIDAVKVSACSYSDEKSAIKLKGVFKIDKKKVTVIAVPTTAGSGAEATFAAVISDTISHKKEFVVDTKIIPEVVVLDPELTLSMPKNIMAETALDALAHGLEGALGEFTSKNGDKDINYCIYNILTNLEKALVNPHDLSLRDKIQQGAYYGGKAICKGNVGYIHAFAHSLGVRYNMPHGRAIAVMIVPVLRFYKDKCQDTLAYLYDLVYTDNNSSKSEKAKYFINEIEKLINATEVSLNIENFNKEDIPVIIDEAFKECHGTYPVPKYMTKSDAEKILKDICLNLKV